MDINDNSENNQIMWKLIQLEKPEITKVTMPVYLINGSISYNIEDLKGFTTNLSRFRL